MKAKTLKKSIIQELWIKIKFKKKFYTIKIKKNIDKTKINMLIYMCC